jgi:type II secretory pathway pseudopilin PulG
VLITIAIVGVVAALTIPNLIETYQKRETCIRLKKVYTLLNQAVRAANDEYGDMSGWDYTLSSKEFMKKYFAPYLKLSEVSTRVTFTDLGGTSHVSTFSSEMPDGTLLVRVDFITKHIFIDLNGVSGPNRLGRDMFFLTMIPEKNAIWPYSIYTTTTNLKFPGRANPGYNGTMGQCAYGALGGPAGPGTTCSEVIITQDWTIPKDYPWK